MSWIPGYERHPVMFTSDAIPRACTRDIMNGFRSPASDGVYFTQTDIVSPQLAMRPLIPDVPQIGIGMDQGLQNLES